MIVSFSRWSCRTLFIVLAVWLATISVTWAQPSFKVVCNTSTVEVGQRFQVTYEIGNARVKQFVPPSVRHFDVAGPSKSQSMSYVNGRSSSKLSYTYVFSAQKKGTFKISPAQILLQDGSRLKTKELKIKVVKNAPSQQKSGGGNQSLDAQLKGQVFVRMEVSNTQPVIGEQVTADLKIYTSIGIEQLQITKEPVYKHLFTKEVVDFNSPQEQKVIKGRRYISKLLKRIIVIPTKGGKATIGAAEVTVGVPVNGRGSIFNPFYELAEHGMKSPKVVLDVKEPANPPAGYTGAVGNYSMQAYAEQTTITSDDVLQIRIKIKGTGDVRQISEMQLEADPAHFDSYKPNVKTTPRKSSQSIGGVVEFEYVLRPRAVGSFEIKPSFVFYNPARKKFQTLDTVFTFKVSKGNNPLPSEQTAAEQYAEEESATVKLSAPLKEATFVKHKTFFFDKPLYWGLLLLPFVLLFGFKYAKKQQQFASAKPNKKKQRKAAASQADSRLQKAKVAMTEQDAKGFYDEISKALLGFVGSQYNLSASELNKQNVRQKLSEQKISSDKIDALVGILQKSEMALFAGLADTNSMNAVYTETQELIQLMEKS